MMVGAAREVGVGAKGMAMARATVVDTGRVGQDTGKEMKGAVMVREAAGAAMMTMARDVVAMGKVDLIGVKEERNG